MNGPIDGLLIVDKPGLPDSTVFDGTGPETTRLPTSHDIVQKVRRWSGQRRIGHTGTLDPMASGVLVLCLGKATRLVEYYQGHDKAYEAEIRLGAATDSYDATGATVETAPVPSLNEAEIERGLARFRGEILQVPPIYSALKQEGETLYRKARRGEAVEIAPRPVTMHRIDLIEFTPPDRLRLSVVCSAGAYIRSLAHDLGIALGTVAHLARLRRTAAGPFTLADAHTPDEIEAACRAGELGSLLLPPGHALEMPSLQLDNETIRRLGHGQLVELENTLPPGTLAQARSAEGRFLGVIRRVQVEPEIEAEDKSALWKAEKWLATG